MSAWGSSWGAAWADSWGPVSATHQGGILVPTYAGRTEEDREARRLAREEFDRIPVEAREVIEAELESALETRQANEAALKHRFAVAELRYEAAYMRALLLELERAQEMAQLQANNDAALVVILLLQ